MLCRELPETGWIPEVLSPHPIYYREDTIEQDAVGSIPKELVIHYSGVEPDCLRRLFGNRFKQWRTLILLYFKGRRVLDSNRFDTVYFSTTSFALFVLGRLWALETGVNYILDFHDPWFHRERQARSAATLKTALSSMISHALERFSVPRASGLVVVSEAYAEMYANRYANAFGSGSAKKKIQCVPFAASQSDFDYLDTHRWTNDVFDPEDGALHVIYVGAGGAIMKKGFESLCSNISGLVSQGHSAAGRLRIHLLGTMYGWRDADPKTLELIAAELGLEGLVIEDPRRVPYFKALHFATAAHGLLVLGVDDPGYFPSKLFTYGFTGKPLLAVLHEDSPALRHFEGPDSLGYCLRFGSDGASSFVDDQDPVARFLTAVERNDTSPRTSAQFEKYLAPAMARRHAEFFQSCLRESN